ncbi:MAG: radical SAM protein [Polyangiales bacterium]
MSGTEARLTFFTGDRLEYRFCTPSWRDSRAPVPVESLLAEVDALDPARLKRLLLADGPLDHPGFERVSEALRRKGIQHVSAECDAPSLAREGALERLREAGVEKVFTVCGGIRKRVHEHVMADPEGFLPAMEGLRRAAASGIPLYVSVPVLKWTEQDLVPLFEWLLALPGGVRAFLLAVPEVSEVPAALRKVLLRYGEVARLAGGIFDRCRRSRVEYGFASRRGVLPCATDGALDGYGTVLFDRMDWLRKGRSREETFVRVDACEACSLAQSCPGVEPAYLEAFGDEELRAVPLETSMNWRLKRINDLEHKDFSNVAAFDNDGESNGRSLIRINGHCNMSCAFCFVDRTVPDFPAERVLADIEALAARNLDHLVLSGGEPTLHPQLADFIARARALGFRTIEMQSNGVRAADLNYARTLVEAGLNKVTFSLHSIDPAHSDRITRLPGAFPKTLAAMHNFRRLGILTQVAHVITKSNFAELPDTVRFLRETFPEDEGHLSVCFGIAQPISDLVYTWVMPTFSEIKPFMQQALDYCIETRVGFGGMIGQGGYPPCMLDGDMRYYAQNLGNIYRSADHDEQFHKPEACRSCSFDPWCLGVRKLYVETYGADEIKPFTADIEAMIPEGARMNAALPRPEGLVQLRVRREGEPRRGA